MTLHGLFAMHVELSACHFATVLALHRRSRDYYFVSYLCYRLHRLRQPLCKLPVLLTAQIDQNG